MTVMKYAINETLVILFGKKYIDIYQGIQKDFNVENKVYKEIQIHLIDILDDNEFAIKVSKIINDCITCNEEQLKSIKCGLSFYLHYDKSHYDTKILGSTIIIKYLNYLGKKIIRTYDVDNVLSYIKYINIVNISIYNFI